MYIKPSNKKHIKKLFFCRGLFKWQSSHESLRHKRHFPSRKCVIEQNQIHELRQSRILKHVHETSEERMMKSWIDKNFFLLFDDKSFSCSGFLPCSTFPCYQTNKNKMFRSFMLQPVNIISNVINYSLETRNCEDSWFKWKIYSLRCLSISEKIHTTCHSDSELSK